MRLAALAVAAASIAACTSARAERSSDSLRTPPPETTHPTTSDAPDTTVADTSSPETSAPDTSAPDTSAPDTTTPDTSAPDTTTPDTSAPDTTAPNTTSPNTSPDTTTPDGGSPSTDDPGVAPPLPALDASFDRLAVGNAAASLTVIRDHVEIYGRASGATTGGTPMTPDSPLVLASVSKLVTALTVARLAEDHEIDVAAPVPWDQLFIAHDPAWNDVTVRELLDHTGGMPKAQASWLNQPGSCAVPLGAAIARPPTGTRGKWSYSNGNYCALGLLIESVTGQSQAHAADDLVFGPIGVTGPHLTTDGLLPGDGPYVQGVVRLDRLGGAGTWLASTHDMAAMLDSVTPADLETLRYPGIITDQYGWGHTGTVDGAKACAWVMDGARTVVVAIVSGNRPATGGKVCDAVIPSLAADLGIWAGEPIRVPV